MNRRKLQLMVSGIFLLGIIVAAFAAPVQAQTTLCWEVSVVVGSSGQVFIGRASIVGPVRTQFNSHWDWTGSRAGDNTIGQLTPGSTFVRVIALSPGTAVGVATWDDEGQNFKSVIIRHDAFDIAWNADHGHFDEVGSDGIINQGYESEWITTRLLSYTDAEACHGGFRDGRLNWQDVSVNAALYNYNGGLRVYLIDEATSNGWLAIDASAGEVSAAIAEAQATGVNQMIGQTEFWVSLWALATSCDAGDNCVQMNYSHYDGTPLIFIAAAQ